MKTDSFGREEQILGRVRDAGGGGESVRRGGGASPDEVRSPEEAQLPKRDGRQQQPAGRGVLVSSLTRQHNHKKN